MFLRIEIEFLLNHGRRSSKSRTSMNVDRQLVDFQDYSRSTASFSRLCRERFRSARTPRRFQVRSRI